MSTELAMWLRRQRQDRSWSRLDMARRLIRAGQEAGDTSLPTLDSMDSMDHNVYRWERGPDAPSERFMLYYCRVLSISVDEYGPGQPDAAGLPKAPAATTAVAVLAAPGLTAAPWLAQLSPAALDQVGHVNPALLATADLAYGGINGPDEARYLIEREVHMAAQDGSERAAQADGPGIGEATMEQLRADVVRLSRLTDTGEPFAVFLDLRRVRERIYRVLDRRLWPREQSDPALPARLPERPDGRQRQATWLPGRCQRTDPGRLGACQRRRPLAAHGLSALLAFLRRVLARQD